MPEEESKPKTRVHPGLAVLLIALALTVATYRFIQWQKSIAESLRADVGRKPPPALYSLGFLDGRHRIDTDGPAAEGVIDEPLRRGIAKSLGSARNSAAGGTWHVFERLYTVRPPHSQMILAITDSWVATARMNQARISCIGGQGESAGTLKSLYAYVVDDRWTLVVLVNVEGRLLPPDIVKLDSESLTWVQ